MDVIEVKVSTGMGVKGSYQFGQVETTLFDKGVVVEGKVGVGGGDPEVKASLKLAEGSVNAGPVQGKYKVGAEISSNGEATFGGSVSGKVGPLQGSVSADVVNGVKTSATVEGSAKFDEKIGFHGHGVGGIGLSINLSQASRASQRTREGLQAFADSVYDRLSRMLPDVMPDNGRQSPIQK